MNLKHRSLMIAAGTIALVLAVPGTGSAQTKREALSACVESGKPLVTCCKDLRGIVVTKEFPNGDKSTYCIFQDEGRRPAADAERRSAPRLP